MIFTSHVPTDLLACDPKSSSIQVTVYYDFFFSTNYSLGIFSLFLSFDSDRTYVGENKIGHFPIISYCDGQNIMCQIFVTQK